MKTNLDPHQPHEELLYPPTCTRRVDGVPTEVPYELYREVYEANQKKCQRGRTICVYAAAPGTGQRTYIVNRVDETGVYAVMVRNTFQMLTPDDVR